MNKSLSRDGFGIVSMIVAAGLFSILCLTMMELMALAVRTQHTMMVQNALSDFFYRVGSIVTRQATCTAGLAGARTDAPITLLDPENQNRALASPGAQYGGWALDAFYFKDIQAITGYTDLYRGTLSMQITRKFTVPGVPQTIIRDLPGIYFNATDGKITSCLGTTNWAEVSKSNCAMLGGQWTDKPNLQCLIAQNKVNDDSDGHGNSSKSNSGGAP